MEFVKAIVLVTVNVLYFNQVSINSRAASIVLHDSVLWPLNRRP